MTSTSYDGPCPFLEGRAAFMAGLPLSANPHDTALENGWRWVGGWLAASTEAAQAAVLRRSAQQGNRVHNTRYPGVAEWLADAAIDPYDLRDYLAGLPERE